MDARTTPGATATTAGEKPGSGKAELTEKRSDDAEAGRIGSSIHEGPESPESPESPADHRPSPGSHVRGGVGTCVESLARVSDTVRGRGFRDLGGSVAKQRAPPPRGIDPRAPSDSSPHRPGLAGVPGPKAAPGFALYFPRPPPLPHPSHHTVTAAASIDDLRTKCRGAGPLEARPRRLHDSRVDDLSPPSPPSLLIIDSHLHKLLQPNGD
jgi:hypothetical protein